MCPRQRAVIMELYLHAPNLGPSMRKMKKKSKRRTFSTLEVLLKASKAIRTVLSYSRGAHGAMTTKCNVVP